MTSPTRTHRDHIEAIIRQHGETAERFWPDALRNPTTEREFDLAVALLLHSKEREGFTGGPIYDVDGWLIGWNGIVLQPWTWTEAQ